jgi:hypothetical protein
MAPALLCCLAADAESGRDLGPGVPSLTQSDYGLGDGLVQLSGEPGHVGQGVNVATRNSPRVGANNASDEPAYWSFSTVRRRWFGVNLTLTLDRPPRSSAPEAWSAMRGVIACSFRLGRQRGSWTG